MKLKVIQNKKVKEDVEIFKEWEDAVDYVFHNREYPKEVTKVIYDEFIYKNILIKHRGDGTEYYVVENKVSA